MKGVAFWTRERVAKLRRLWKTDLASSIIAKRLGCTKSAACGKAARLGLPEKPNALISYSRRAVSWRQECQQRSIATRQARAR